MNRHADPPSDSTTDVRRPALTAVEELALSARLPLPARTRLLLELRHDLRGLTERLVEQGWAVEEARRRAEEALIPTGRALEELERIAQPAYRRLTRAVAPGGVRIAERIALATATMLLVVLEGGTLVRGGLLSDPSLYLWPVLSTGTMALAAVVAKAFQLWVKGAHERPRRGLTTIIVLSGLTLATGCTGALFGTVTLASMVEAAPDAALELTRAWLVRDAALLSAAIILAVSGALGWLVLRGWITWTEHAHAEALGTYSPHSTQETSS